MELGIYTFGDITPDPNTGRTISIRQRYAEILAAAKPKRRATRRAISSRRRCSSAARRSAFIGHLGIDLLGRQLCLGCHGVGLLGLHLCLSRLGIELLGPQEKNFTRVREEFTYGLAEVRLGPSACQGVSLDCARRDAKCGEM
jgi:hypothetical protein